MAVQNIVPARAFGAQAAAASAAQAGNEPLPDAIVWLNVGYYGPDQTDEQGNTVRGAFVSLGGLPVDTMKLREKANTQLGAAKHKLRDDLVEYGMTLEPGEAREVILSCELRRIRSDEAATIEATSPFARSAPLFAVPAATTEKSAK